MDKNGYTYTLFYSFVFVLQLAGDVNRAINPKRFLPLMSYNQATAHAGVSEEKRAKCKDDKPFFS